MAKKVNFELNFTFRNNNELVSHDHLEAADLVSLLAQFQLVLASTARKMVQIAERKRSDNTDDDVPF